MSEIVLSARSCEATEIIRVHSVPLRRMLAAEEDRQLCTVGRRWRFALVHYRLIRMFIHPAKKYGNV
jgi:hypothetical protein